MRTHLRGFSRVTLAILLLLQVGFVNAQDKAAGEKIFKTNCTACHAIGSVLVGPDLTGVKSRWKDEGKLISFVRNSTAVIQSGDPYAKALFEKFNQTMMTPQDLTDQQIKDVLAYVDAPSSDVTAATSPTAPTGGASYTKVPADDSFMQIVFWGIIILLVAILFLSFRILRELRGDEGGKPRRLWVQANAFIFPIFLILFFGLSWWETTIHTDYIRPSQAASDVGEQIDVLFNWTMWVTLIVFIITQVLLFWYAFRYRHRDGKKAYFYSHNNTLEIVWTSIPAVVLAFLVIWGFQTWTKATSNPDDNPITIEAFAKQFDWTFRYAGPDGKLGKVDFRKIDPATNPLGIDFSDPASHDDFLTTELRLPKGQDVYLKLRSQDVIHAAYLVHFRMQMYAQPGMDTRLRFKPTITTAEMRAQLGRPDFNYEIACNQLCGAAHFNMRRLVIVDTQEDYKTWTETDKKPAYEKFMASQATASNE